MPRSQGSADASSLIAEPTSAEPGPCEDFGGQIGGMLANPCPRPRKHLTDVPVVNLRKRVGITRTEEFRARRPGEVASHNLYFAAPQKVCHARQGVAVCGRATLPDRPKTHSVNPAGQPGRRHQPQRTSGATARSAGRAPWTPMLRGCAASSPTQAARHTCSTHGAWGTGSCCPAELDEFRAFGRTRARLGGTGASAIQLLLAPPCVFSKDELLKDVWGYRSIGRTRTLDSHGRACAASWPRRPARPTCSTRGG